MPKIIYNKIPDFDLSTLKRTEQIQFDYDEHKADLKKKGIKPSTFILRNEFRNSNQLLALVKNNFPYDLPENWDHWLLWIRPNYFEELRKEYGVKISEEDFKVYLRHQIKLIVINFFTQNSILIIYKNDMEVQSVPDLEHYQIFIDKNIV